MAEEALEVEDLVVEEEAVQAEVVEALVAEDLGVVVVAEGEIRNKNSICCLPLYQFHFPDINKLIVDLYTSSIKTLLYK